VTFVDFLMAPADSVNESNHLKGTTGLTQPRDQPGLALSAILIAEYARLAQAVAAKPARTKQTVALLVNGADRLLFAIAVQISRCMSSTVWIFASTTLISPSQYRL
jgi:hypothetical protein